MFTRMPAYPGQPPSAATSESRPVLDDAEAQHRLLFLAALKASLADLGVASILARKHSLALRYTDGIAGPNGLTDPELHVLGPPQIRVATTDGAVYRLVGSREYPVADPAAAATLISRELEPAAGAPALSQ